MWLLLQLTTPPPPSSSTGACRWAHATGIGRGRSAVRRARVGPSIAPLQTRTSRACSVRAGWWVVALPVSRHAKHRAHAAGQRQSRARWAETARLPIAFAASHTHAAHAGRRRGNRRARASAGWFPSFPALHAPCARAREESGTRAADRDGAPRHCARRLAHAPLLPRARLLGRAIAHARAARLRSNSPFPPG